MSNKTLLAIDVGSTSITAVIAKNNLDGKINILGTGTSKSEGINKGSITNIEVASKAIKNAVNIARGSTSEVIDSSAISISGAYTKGLRSLGSVNVPNGLITETEINQVMQMALYNATIIPEYEVVHVLPIFFKVDDSKDVENPLNMNGSRLEVSVYIVTAKRTALTNVKSALKQAGIELTNFVLDGYASAISLLDEQQNKFGATVINIGGTTTEFVSYKGSSIVFNGFIPVGSNHITNDLSVMLHTPPNAAETLKIKYGNLLKSNENEDLTIKKVKIPRIGDEQSTSEVSLDHIQTIIHARVEEILVLVRNKLKQSGIQENIGAGIVITGGMSQLSGIKELATKVFENTPIKISNPINIKNGYMNFDDPTLSTTVGLLFYGLDDNRAYELDSNKKLMKRAVKKEELTIPPIQKEEPVIKEEKLKEKINETLEKEDNTKLPTLSKKDKGRGMSRFWSKVSEWF
ncbi:cell division protein FtsA [Malaciobacter marinus]|uniref:Cell division protein FtsA n=1 Tax=Malaciobacter marinus TaxID=505249 RepID=A0A347TL81_9BACT|nr:MULTISPECIES: cell division protein FtsA [Malaciobacter]AXX87359.1 cell division protein FtsA [Malaciobacter marinus]PHO13622.1 cell division protein FtsA [Malaciobacter marinus]PHO15227.1 cell division protein FtsA [Malaciobacter marinus]RYA23993.1 cell division protein FtsA [Malaciobacter halophilus]